MINGTGKRKTAIARIYLKLGNGEIIINGLNFNKYFFKKSNILLIKKPSWIFNSLKKFNIKINVKGGGIISQINAIKLGIFKALINYNKIFKKKFSKLGYLNRDSRIVERKKFGLKKARKSKQFSKR